MAKYDATITVGADASGIESGLGRASAKTREAAGQMATEFKGVGESLSGLHSKIATAFEFIGAAAAIEGIRMVAEGLNQAAERAEQFKNSARLVGATTTEFQGLAATAAQAGVPMATLQRGMMTLSQRMTMARDGSQSAREQLEKVGISAADLANPAFTAANALYTVAKSGAAAGDVQIVLGQRSAMLGAAFGQLAGGQQAMEAEARRVNALNQNEIETLEKYKARVSVLGIEYDNLKGKVGAYLINASGPLMDSLHQLRAAFGSGTEGVDIMKGAFAILEDAIIVVVDGIKGLVQEFEALGHLAGDVMGGIATVMHDVFTGNWKNIKSDSETAFKMVAADGMDAFKAIGDTAAAQISAIKSTWGSAFKAQPEDTKPEERAQTGGGGTGGTTRGGNSEVAAMRKVIADKRALIRQELAEMTKEMNQEVEVAKTGYKAQLDAHLAVLDRETAAVKNAAKEGMIGPEQEFVQLRAILQQKLAAQTAYYEKLKVLAQGNRVELAKLDADEQKDQQTYLTQVSKLHEQATAQIDRQWNMVANRIGTSWSSMIDKMLQGTMSFHQLITRTLDQMLMNFIKMETMSLAHHLATEAAKAEASKASSLIQQTSAQAAGKESILQSGIAGLKKIMNDAYQAASGAFQATVGIPIIGPVLAPAAGAAAFAAVTAFSGGIASAAGGYDIPSGVNPVTQLHQREMVLPAPIADNVRNMAGGGGPSPVHINVSNQVGDFFLMHRDELADAINKISQQRHAVAGVF